VDRDLRRSSLSKSANAMSDSQMFIASGETRRREDVRPSRSRHKLAVQHGNPTFRRDPERRDGRDSRARRSCDCGGGLPRRDRFIGADAAEGDAEAEFESFTFSGFIERGHDFLKASGADSDSQVRLCCPFLNPLSRRGAESAPPHNYAWSRDGHPRREASG
jgi:hypothetical protein